MNVKEHPKLNNNFAFAGYIVGLVGILLCWVPLLGLALSLISGVLLAVGWIVGQDRRKGFLLVGTGIVLLGLIFSFVSTGKVAVHLWDKATAPMSPREAFEAYGEQGPYISYSETTGGLTVDTNPTDEPDGEMTEAYQLIAQLNEEYQVPTEAREQMKAVTETDGWQSCETEHNSIMWHYYPTHGFEVIYY